jgi:hypothetical protein
MSATELRDPDVDMGTGAREGEGVRPRFNAEAIAPEVRGEIRRRVGQRVRELRRAVEALEERAMEE